MGRRGRRQGKVRLKTLVLLLLAMLAILALWYTPVIYPLKLLVVFFHELSHGLMAILTGGQIAHIKISPLIGGECQTIGGSRFLILCAGYLGSLVWGGVILLIAMRTLWWRPAVGYLGMMLTAVALIWVRNWFGFGFALLIGVLLILSAYKLSESFNRVLLIVIGLASCLYVVADIFYDTVLNAGACSDARQLAELTHIPTIVWGLGWTLTALLLGGWCVVAASRRPER